MHGLRRLVTYGLTVMLAFAAPALGGEVTLDHYEIAKDGSSLEIYVTLTGPIVGDEMEQVSDIMLEVSYQLSGRARRYVEISLDSPGGSFPGGAKLMRLFARNAIATRVRAGDQCLSACAIAFLGGSKYRFDWEQVVMQRVVEPGGTLGFHAPSLEVPSDVTYNSGSVSKAYQVALESLGILVGFEFEIPRSLIATILETPPQDMYVLRTVDDFARWQIDVDWDNPGWKPHARDIARICVQNYTWRYGVSIAAVNAAAGRDAAETERLVVDLAAHVGEFPGSGKGRYAYVNAPDLMDRLCIVALLRTEAGWRPNAMGFYVPDGSVSYEEIVRSDNMDIVVREIDYLPYDTDVFTLR